VTQPGWGDRAYHYHDRAGGRLREQAGCTVADLDDLRQVRQHREHTVAATPELDEAVGLRHRAEFQHLGGIKYEALRIGSRESL